MFLACVGLNTESRQLGHVASELWSTGGIQTNKQPNPKHIRRHGQDMGQIVEKLLICRMRESEKRKAGSFKSSGVSRY